MFGQFGLARYFFREVQTIGVVEYDTREFAMQPFEPSDGCLVLHKLMANGSNGFDACPYF
jgi:hypothetical protein